MSNPDLFLICETCDGEWYHGIDYCPDCDHGYRTAEDADSHIVSKWLTDRDDR